MTPPAQDRGEQFARAATVLISILAFGLMEWIALTQWLTGRWYLADVGNIHYCLYHTLFDGFMVSPLVGHQNHFAYHVTPLLVLLAPLVLLSSYPVPLVTAYVAALASAVPAVYRVARRAGANPWTSAALGLLFIANHFVGSLQLANHFESFFVALTLWAMATMPRRTGVWFAVLAMLVKEDAALWIGAWALIEWWLTPPAQPLRRRWLGLAWLAAGIFLAAMATLAILQQCYGRGAFSAYAPRFARAGIGLDTALTSLALLASFCFLPLGAGRRLGLLLVPFPMLLASFPFMRNLLYYYSYPFLPFLVLTSAHGLARLEARLARAAIARPQPLLAGVIVIVAGLQWFLPTRTDGYLRVPFPVSERDRYRFDIARTVLPRQAPVAIQFGLWGIVPARLGAHLLSPSELRPTDWVFMDLASPHGLASPEEFIAVARAALADAAAGRRRALHAAYDIFVLSPVETNTTATRP